MGGVFIIACSLKYDNKFDLNLRRGRIVNLGRLLDWFFVKFLSHVLVVFVELMLYTLVWISVLAMLISCL